jgi:hypothetical protein
MDYTITHVDRDAIGIYKDIRQPVDVRYSRKFEGWLLFLDGEVDGSFWQARLYSAREGALNWYFTEEAYGYSVAYFSDGEMLCAECAKFAWKRGVNLEKVQLSDPQSDGESCSACWRYISDPYCRLCGTTDTERLDRAFRNDEGCGLVCRQCMCEARWNTVRYHSPVKFYVTAELVRPGMYRLYQEDRDDPRYHRSDGFYYAPDRHFTDADWNAVFGR